MTGDDGWFFFLFSVVSLVLFGAWLGSHPQRNTACDCSITLSSACGGNLKDVRLVLICGGEKIPVRLVRVEPAP
jgi:hypothetical protein